MKGPEFARSLSLLFVCLPAMSASPSALAGSSDYPVQPVPFTDVRFSDGVLKDRQDINTKVTLPFAMEQCETQGRMKNFDLAAEVMRRRAAGETTFQIKPPTQYTFDDTDPYKVLEGASFCLSTGAPDGLKAQMDGFIRRIAAAQEPDGYLYTFRTMHPDSPGHPWIGQQRWEKDPDLSHELYNLGHLYEAGVAHARATGDKSLLDVCLKSAELLYRDFGDGEPKIATGHQVVEMGLAKLYRQTGDKRWMELAKFFLDARGDNGHTYSQNHQPVVDQSEAVGHAVRANYLYSGMADVAALTGDTRYTAAIHRIWDNVVGKKLHLTGGCGARGAGEAYGDNYELPHRCYNETCAAIAFLFWNHRMFLLTGESKYMDVFERTLYNGFLSGVSLSGDRFFYPNPLEYDGKAKNNHGHAGRAPWFGCACCPPNVLRLMASLTGYAYAVKGDRIFTNLYAGGEAKVSTGASVVTLRQETAYPWDGKIRITVTPSAPATFDLALRLPGWNQGRPLPSDLYTYVDASPAAWSLAVNGGKAEAKNEAGYLVVRRDWKPGDVVELDLAMPVRRVLGHEKIAATAGQVALERGPVVYAFEGIDNEESVFDLFLPDSVDVAVRHQPELLTGVTTLSMEGALRARRNEDGNGFTAVPARLVAIPYAFWNNRGNSQMTVWLPRDASLARVPPVPTLSSTAKVSTSSARAGMDPALLNDQLYPRNATDGFAPNFDFWPRKGGQEWVQYDLAQPTLVESVGVSWFDDTGTGECRLPVSWKVLWQDEAGQWSPVQAKGPYEIKKAELITLAIEPVRAKAMRLEIQQPEGFSCGLWEWVVTGQSKKP